MYRLKINVVEQIDTKWLMKTIIAVCVLCLVVVVNCVLGGSSLLFALLATQDFSLVGEALKLTALTVALTFAFSLPGYFVGVALLVPVL